MKKITKKQMSKLKGKVSEMDYNLSNLSNSTTVLPPNSATTQSTVCKAMAIKGDED